MSPDKRNRKCLSSLKKSEYKCYKKRKTEIRKHDNFIQIPNERLATIPRPVHNYPLSRTKMCNGFVINRFTFGDFTSFTKTAPEDKSVQNFYRSKYLLYSTNLCSSSKAFRFLSGATSTVADPDLELTGGGRF